MLLSMTVKGFGIQNPRYATGQSSGSRSDCLSGSRWSTVFASGRL